MVVNATHKTVSLGWPRDASPVRKVVTATLVIPIALLVLVLVAILLVVVTVASLLVFALVALAVLVMRGGDRHGSRTR